MSSPQKIILILTILVGSFSLSLPLLRSGLKYSYGIGFWGPMGHDGVWHLSLINHIKNPFFIPLPGFSGEKLQNYHPFYDILISYLSKITHLSASFWFFQLGPIIMSSLFLYLSFLLAYRLTNSFISALFLVFLNSFSNSFGWLVTLIRHRSLGGESLFYSMQPPSTQINPPFALSLIFLFILLLILSKIPKKFSLTESVAIITILTLLPITKAYGGLAAFVLFGLYSFFRAIQNNFQPLKIFFIALFIAIGAYLWFNPKSGNIIEFQPFTLVNSMTDSPDRLYLPKISSFRYNTALQNPLDPRLLLVLLFSALIFLIGNLSWRIIGFIRTPPLSHPLWGSILISTILLSLIPVFFVQKATSWNIIQFFYYAIFLSNLLLVNFIANHRHYTSAKLLSILIIITSIIANIPTYQNYFGNPSPASLPPSEVSALNFLALQPKGIVLTYPYYPESKKDFPTTPIPLFAYETTAYVSAFSNHFVFLEDTMNLNNSGYPWQQRLEQSQKFFAQKSVFEDRGFLINNQIDYIYLTANQTKLTKLNSSDLSVYPIFTNNGATIFKVKK